MSKEKPKRKKYRQKPQPKHMTLYQCFEGAFNEITQLRDEMQENVDNMEEHFRETQRFIDTEEALGILEEKVEQYFDGWEEALKASPKEFMEVMHIVKQFTYLKGRGLARWRRMSNCVFALDYGKNRLEEYMDTTPADDLVGSELDALARLQEICDEMDGLEDIEWPRMYG